MLANGISYEDNYDKKFKLYGLSIYISPDLQVQVINSYALISFLMDFTGIEAGVMITALLIYTVLIYFVGTDYFKNKLLISYNKNKMPRTF